MLSGPKRTVARARQLRREMSWPEVMLWQRLRQRPDGFKFRRQHPAGPYVLDFFCSRARLAIEIDGMAHDFADRADRDDDRSRWLSSNGVAVLRIAAGDVTRNPDAVAQAIVAECSARIPLHHPADGPPPRSGEEMKAAISDSLAATIRESRP